MDELQSKSNNTLGDVWNCKADNKNYCWNKEEWIDIGIIIDLSSYPTTVEVTQLLNKMQDNIEEAINKKADTTIATQEVNGLMSKEDKVRLDKMPTIIDTLTSTNSTDGLSANQGRILNEIKLGTTTMYEGDLNSITSTSFYYCTKTCLNKPVDIDGFLFTQYYPLTQSCIYQRYVVCTTGAVYERIKYSGNWKEWAITGEIFNDTSLKLDKSKIIEITPTHPDVTNYSIYGNTYFYKVGTKVHLHIGVKIDTTDWITMFSLPAGFRPFGLVAVQGIGSGTQGTTGVQIDSAGNVQTSTINKYCCLDIEYDAFY